MNKIISFIMLCLGFVTQAKKTKISSESVKTALKVDGKNHSEETSEEKTFAHLYNKVFGADKWSEVSDKTVILEMLKNKPGMMNIRKILLGYICAHIAGKPFNEAILNEYSSVIRHYGTGDEITFSAKTYDELKIIIDKLHPKS